MRIFLLFALALVLSTASCVSRDAVDDASEAVSCAKCEAVWVRHGHRHPKRTARLYHVKLETVCADCDRMACAYLEKGEKFEACPQCLVKPTATKASRPIRASGRRFPHN